jgi:2-polyprenyl-3-methyl-5-hydroxy-6-metoxy-1,4-benzoquinol methylase
MGGIGYMKLIEKFKMDIILDSWESYRRTILSLLEPDGGAQVIDLGPGEGEFTKRIAKVIGVSRVGMVELETKASRTKAIPGDLNEVIGAPSDFYDVVIASHIIEHLWNTDGFMREVKRILKPSGYLVLSTPNLASWHNVIFLAMGKQPEPAAVSDEMYSWIEIPGHQRVFTATELTKFLSFHGFRIEKLVGSSYYPLMGKSASFLARLDWKHAAITTIKARKK